VPGSAASPAGLSRTANSYIGLGAFETMGSDVGRMATGISYLETIVAEQEAAYEAETTPLRRAVKAIPLLKSRLEVGRQHHQQQDPQEAIKQYSRARELAEEAIQSLSSAKSVNYARFLLSEVCSSLGVAHNDVGDAESALAMHERALAIRKETVGEEHPAVAECYNNLGALFFSQGSFQQAVSHYEQALPLLMLGSGGKADGPYVALTLYNVGVCHDGLGNAEASVAALTKALEVAEKALGSDHPKVGLIKATIEKVAAGQKA